MKIFIILTVVLCPLMLLAQQGDPSALGYLPTTSQGDFGHDGMEANRYVKKPQIHTKAKRKRSIASEQVKKSNAESEAEVVPPNAPDAHGPKVAPLPGLTEGPASYSNESIPQPPPPSQEENSPGIGQRMRDLVLGGDLELIDRYRSFLDMEDIRKNIFEYSMGTTYLYNTSMSPYYFRNYINSSPGAFLGLDLWLTPFLGIDADYRFSILSEVKDSPTQDNYTNISHSWFDLGIKFRRFFGIGLNSSYFSVGIRYADYMMSVQPNAQSRLSQHTHGPELNVELSLPSTKNYSWNFGVILQPFLTHEEVVKSTDLTSGTGNQTVGFGSALGGEYRFSRQTRAFFKFSTMLYKSQFSGQTTAIDPNSGSFPSGVPVSNVFYFLDLGLRLGR